MPGLKSHRTKGFGSTVQRLILLLQGHEHARDVPELLGTTENELGIRPWLESQGHTLVTTSDKEGENSTFDKELVDAEVIITTPYVCNCHLRIPDLQGKKGANNQNRMRVWLTSFSMQLPSRILDRRASR